MFKNTDEYKIVSVIVAPIYNQPCFSSELINQALFWEELIVLNKKNNWLHVKQRDQYIGWIHSFYTSDSYIYKNRKELQKIENWYFVKNRFCKITLRDKTNYHLSFGSLLPCLNNENKFKIIFPNGEESNINKNNLIRSNKRPSIETVLKWSESLLGIPYLWGGKSSFAYDCSGLIQSILSLMNIHFPRDTKDQINSNKIEQIHSDNIESGNLIYFFDGDKPVHVGIFRNSETFIHSSGCVKKNSIIKNNVYYDESLSIMKSKVFKLKA